MTAFTWVGTSATSFDGENPSNWSPAGLPASVTTDTATINTGQIDFGAVPAGQQQNLNGVPLTAHYSSILLEQGANLVINASNVGGPAVLPGGADSLSLATGSTASLNVIEGQANVYSFGNSTLAATSFEAGLNVNISSGTTLTLASGNAGKASAFAFQGGGTLNLQGGLGGYAGGSGAIDINVGRITGPGGITVPDALYLGGVVDSTSINIDLPFSTVTLATPGLFHGTILDTTPLPTQSTGQPVPNSNHENVLLLGETADGYTYANGQLTLYQGNNPAYSIKLQTEEPVIVSQTATGVDLWTGGGYDPAKAGTVLSPYVAPQPQPQPQPQPGPGPIQGPPIINQNTIVNGMTLTNSNTIVAQGGGGGGGGNATANANSGTEQVSVIPPTNNGANPTPLSANESTEQSGAALFGQSVAATDMTFIVGGHLGADFSALGTVQQLGQDQAPFDNQMVSDLKALLSDWSAAQPGLTTGIATPGGPSLVLPADFVVNIVNDGLHAALGQTPPTANIAFGGAVQQFFGIDRSLLLAHTA